MACHFPQRQRTGTGQLKQQKQSSEVLYQDRFGVRLRVLDFILPLRSLLCRTRALQMPQSCNPGLPGLFVLVLKSVRLLWIQL